MDVRVGLWRRLSPKNWCFWTVVLEKTLESPLDCKKIQSVHSKGDQPWVFFGRTDANAETPILWTPHAKSWLIGKDPDARRDWGQEEKGTTEDEMAGWHHWLDGREFEWTLGDGDGQGGLVCYSSWGRKDSDTTEQLNWTDTKGNKCLPRTFLYLMLCGIFLFNSSHDPLCLYSYPSTVHETHKTHNARRLSKTLVQGKWKLLSCVQLFATP